jgi:hypothetical protein
MIIEDFFMKKNILYLILGLALIFHSVYGLGHFSQRGTSNVNTLNLLFTAAELLLGGYLFYLYKRSDLTKNQKATVSRQKGHVNIAGFGFGSIVLGAGIYLMYLKFYHHKGDILTDLFFVLFGISLLGFSFYQYKKSS